MSADPASGQKAGAGALDDLRARFLSGMGAVACTVSVVTTDGPSGRHGVTVSAMASVSADGERPTLLVCVHHKSPAAAAILGNRAFCLNTLSADQAHVSDAFAGRGPTRLEDKFDAVTWTAGAVTGAPRISGALVAFDCRLLSAERVGTHHVFIGAVEDVHRAGDGQPLVYANRAYGIHRPLDAG